LLNRQSPRERLFAEAFACGFSASDAYRKALGKTAGNRRNADRQQGYKIKSRPRVGAAIQAMLTDRSVSARMDREGILLLLREIIEKCRYSGSPAERHLLIHALRLMAKIQGELDNHQSTRKQATGNHTAGEIRARVAQIIAEAKCGDANTGGPSVGVVPFGTSIQHDTRSEIRGMSPSTAKTAATASAPPMPLENENRSSPPIPWLVPYPRSRESAFMGVGG
jgi:hypothetical protein